MCGRGSDEGGTNAIGFLRLLQQDSFDATHDSDYEQLAKARGLLNSETLFLWQICKSVLSHTWLVPGYGADGKLKQLYRYGRRLIPTPKLWEKGNSHQLFGMNLWDPKKPVVYLCEGPWDAMVLWETLGSVKDVEGGHKLTNNRNNSLLSDANVLAVPGCNSFNPAWAKLFVGKDVCLMFDSDHPRPKTKNGKEQPGAGFAGTKRIVGILTSKGIPLSSLYYLKWGNDGFDPELPSGYDLRDAITASDAPGSRVTALHKLLGRVTGVEKQWLKTPVSGSLKCLPCTDYLTLQTAWKQALNWIPGLDRALCVMLASVISTKSQGDQLWFKIMGPPACGKSTLCEALSVSRYVIAKSTIRGFHSGYKTDKDGKEDHSLIKQATDKTLVIKDGDTLLQAPNKEQILSEARDIYDRISRVHYRHGVNREYKNIDMTWLLCGTSSLRALDTSDLGVRFLDCVIMDGGIASDLEDDLCMRAGMQAAIDVKTLNNGTPEGQQNPEMTLCMQLTGGYVDYLRTNERSIMAGIAVTQVNVKSCSRLAKFISRMRARPSYRQEENVEIELPTRLTKQLVRLATCLSAVLNKNEIDSDVMARVTKVTLDTSRGLTLELLHCIYNSVGGMGIKELQLHTHLAESKAKGLLSFLIRIDVLERFQEDPEPGSRAKYGTVKWRLTEEMSTLYEDVMNA